MPTQRGEPEPLEFAESAYELSGAAQGDFDSPAWRLRYSSLTTPSTVLEHDTASGKRRALGAWLATTKGLPGICQGGDCAAGGTPALAVPSRGCIRGPPYLLGLSRPTWPSAPSQAGLLRADAACCA